MGVMEMGWWQVGRRRQFRRGCVCHPPMLMLYDVTFQINLSNDFCQCKTKKNLLETRSNLESSPI